MNDITQELETFPERFASSRYNAMAHGVLSRHAVLPWEDRREYESLLQSLIVDHDPAGASQFHLVEEIAGVIWRKRRLRMAEAATHQKGLERAGDTFNNTVKHALAHLRPKKVTDEVRQALVTSAKDTDAELRSLKSELKTCRKLADELDNDAETTFDAASAKLDDGIRDWFTGLIDGRFEASDSHTYRASLSDLLHFLTREALPWLESRATELENRPLIREQAFGASFDSSAMEKLARYEVHLDRKLEKSLGVLYRLKELSALPSVSQKAGE